MTDQQVIDDILAREGGYVYHPDDRGGPTNFGITAATLGNWRGWTRPAAPSEVQALSRVEAAAIYQARYIDQPQFVPARYPDDRLRAALIDAGVNLGPTQALRLLQQALRVPADGRYGPQTAAALERADPAVLLLTLTKARCLYYARIVQGDASQAVFLAGWLTRAFAPLLG